MYKAINYNIVDSYTVELRCTSGSTFVVNEGIMAIKLLLYFRKY